MANGQTVARGGLLVALEISSGKINILKDISEHEKFNDGDILVTSMTTPDWEPLMKKSSGIITDKGGRTCHAAIVARELQINAIVGTSNGSKLFNGIDNVTMSCAEGETGKIYEGEIEYEIQEYEVDVNKDLPVNFELILKKMYEIAVPQLFTIHLKS